jgi:hypothetical protein
VPTPVWAGVWLAGELIAATLHARHGARVLAVLAGLIAVGSVVGRGVDLAWADWVTAALVWLFCHQLGYA